MSQSIQQILLPSSATADHLIAAFLLKEYGAKQYPGIEQAEVVFTISSDPNTVLDLGNFIEPDHEFEGVTDAVAHKLTLSRLPELQMLLKWTSQYLKRKQQPSPFDLGGLVPIVAQAGEGQLELIFGVLRLQLEQQRRLYYGLPEEWVKLTKNDGPSDLYDLTVGDKNVVVAVAQSAELGIADYLFQNKKTSADVVIQQFSNGRIDIHTNPASPIDLAEVAKVIRLEEARVHGRDYTMTLRIFFAHEGFAEDSPEWWYDKSQQKFLNNSGPAAKAPQSGLSVQDVLSAVYVGLSSDVWAKDCPPAGCIGNSCYFYDYGLPRCRAREIAVVGDTFEEKFKEKLKGGGKNRGRDRSQNRRQQTQNKQG